MARLIELLHYTDGDIFYVERHTCLGQCDDIVRMTVTATIVLFILLVKNIHQKKAVNA